MALALPARGTPWYAWRPPAHGLVAAWWPMDPRPRTPCDRCSRPASVAINLITTGNWRGGYSREVGREVTLQQGLGTWIMEHRSGSSTPALVGEVCCGSNRQHHDLNLNRTDVIRIYRCSAWLCCGADGRHRRGSTTLARPLCDGHSPLATTPRADKTFRSWRKR